MVVSVLQYMETIKTSEEYRRAIKEDKIAIYYTADWCQPCKVQKKALEVYFKTPIPGTKIAMVDVELDIPEADHVVTIPYWELYEKGEKVDTYDTYLDPQGIRDFLEQKEEETEESEES